MKLKLRMVLIFSVLILFSLHMTVEGAAKLTTVGQHSLMSLKKGKKIESVDQLKTLVEQNAQRIQDGLAMVNAGFLYEPILEAVKNGNVKEKTLKIGDTIEWMLFYSHGKVKEKSNLVWEGKEDLDIFCLPIVKDCKVYRVVIPKACGNIALANSFDASPVCALKVSPAIVNPGGEVTVDITGTKCTKEVEVDVYFEGNKINSKKLLIDNPVWKTNLKDPGNYELKVRVQKIDGTFTDSKCSSKVYVNFPPVCDLKVSPEKGMVGKPITFDASGSTDKDGKITKAEFSVIRVKSNKEVAKNAVTAEPFVWEKKFNKAGDYKIFLKVTDNNEAVSANDCAFDLKISKRFYLLAEAGPGMAKGTYTGVAFVRVGGIYFLIPEKLSALASFGVGFTLAGEPFKNHFMGNLLLNGHFNDFFIGAGVGFSSEVREATLENGVLLPPWKSDFDIVFNLGYNVLETNSGGIGAVFAELRVPIKDGLTFEHYHEILFGFRYMF